ncbi:uncharacterized protein FTJAE_829 [Fusarium tjaetaba]|uniref:Uncharacterized protein n=1 Tax=Fusarium tjaetaba TaxID=1567544 RepID=A0A8H5SAA7_9HYPO|nr:uncharacterized protein FTJAE_829 [Fusarium tjaetaba]KAF5649720.1 hypothetical protein FTJAE_829 [Fusarium tjaetaba]
MDATNKNTVRIQPDPPSYQPHIHDIFAISSQHLHDISTTLFIQEYYVLTHYIGTSGQRGSNQWGRGRGQGSTTSYELFNHNLNTRGGEAPPPPKPRRLFCSVCHKANHTADACLSLPGNIMIVSGGSSVAPPGTIVRVGRKLESKVAKMNIGRN